MDQTPTPEQVTQQCSPKIRDPRKPTGSFEGEKTVRIRQKAGKSATTRSHLIKMNLSDLQNLQAH